MATANETVLADKWIYAKITGDASSAAIVSTRVYADQAPENPTYPIIVYNYQAGFDTRGNGICRIQSNPLYQIKVVCRGAPSASVRTLVNRIDTLFQEAVAEVSESYVFSSRREMPLRYIEPERDSSHFFTHVGGLFRLVVYPQA